MGLFRIKLAKKPLISRTTKLMYGSGSLGYCIISQTSVSLLMYFATVAHKMNPSLAGLALGIGAFWDGAGDPIFGALSDRARGKIFGRRHGFLFFGTILVAIINILLWAMPYEMPMAGKFFYLTAFILLLNTASTVYQTPYHALGLELAQDYNDRSSIEVYKTIFFLFGMIIPVALIAVLFKDQGNISEYMNMAYITSSVMLVFGALSFMGTYNQMPRLNITANTGEIEKQSLVQIFLDFFSAFKIKNFRSLVLGYAISLMSATFITSVGLHFFQFVFGFSFVEYTILLSALFVMVIASQPFWIFMAKKIDKKPTLIMGIIVGLIGIVLEGAVFVLYMYFDGVVPDKPLLLLIPGMAIAGFGTGTIFTLPGSMMGDFITVEQVRTGKNKVGAYNAYMTLANKLSQSVTSMISGFMLDIIGFDANGPMTKGVLSGIGWLLIIGVFSSLFISIIFLIGYGIYKKDVPQLDLSLESEEDTDE